MTYSMKHMLLNATLETMNKQHTHFVSEMRECDLLYETDPSLSLPRLESNLYDDCEFFLPIESNVVVDAPLIDLEESFDYPLTSSLVFAPYLSSTPVDTSVS